MEGNVLASTNETKIYELIVCASCFNDGNYPLIFGDKDFTSRTVLEFIPSE